MKVLKLVVEQVKIKKRKRRNKDGKQRTVTKVSSAS
jgi:hypothetical protein